MSWRLVQTGSGAVRPLVVVYHATAEADPRIAAALSSRACLVNETLPPFAGNYRGLGALTLTTMRAGIESLMASLRCDGFWPIVLVGFSEGCQGVRTQLKAGAVVTATIAIDGTHASSPPAQAVQLDTWRNWFWRCKAKLGKDGLNAPADPEAPIAVSTCSQIQTAGYLNCRKTLELITGWKLEPGGALAEQQVTLHGATTRTITVKIGKPNEYTSGNLRIASYPGNDARTHSGQLLIALPAQLARVAAELGFGGAGAPPVGPTRPVAQKAPPGATTGSAVLVQRRWPARVAGAGLAGAALVGAWMLERGPLW